MASSDLHRHTVEVHCVDSSQVGESTSVHPKDIPRRFINIAGTVWSGTSHSNLNEALATLLEKGFAVFESHEAMFRTSCNASEDKQINAAWFMTAPTAADTTTIPYTDWLPLNTYHEFARYLHAKIDRRIFAKVAEDFGGVLSIGGFRRRNMAGLGPQPNLHFLHQDECKLSVCVAEAMADAVRAAGPFDGADTVPTDVREVFDASFGEGAERTDRPVCCRQINFWLPHERDGDKHLLVLSREASEAIARQGSRFVTACTLPRHSERAPTAALAEVNRNFQLTDLALEFVAENMPGHVHLINKPVVFVSHYSRVGEGRQSLSDRSDAASAIFHCGAVLAGSGHGSTEFRTAFLSTPSKTRARSRSRSRERKPATGPNC
eukprot:gnl/TRDRNA2_/TRDRNA2_137598_c3_seq1.p1 gnl/TRDRNA2_/TRDRNA2_137598_c3~~gnl/TRDRNA2_/TRDRNA2_137598_c3_seq1.p1  ORF type:complete len:405 (-),score=47.89 gnl/TRDRNA2_/TRDRNA2_137598_c3_seq1:129-1262(-)